MSGFNYDDLKQFERDLERAAAALERSELVEVLKDAMQPVEETAIRNAPKGPSGNLKGTIKTYSHVVRGTVFKVTTGNHRKDWPGGNNDDEYYPAFVEHGHAGPKADSPATPAHPYLRPAFDSHKEEVFQRLGEGLAETLKKNGL